MTILQFEEALPEEELPPPAVLTVKCSWCSGTIRPDRSDPAMAMCPTCYDGMLADFLRAARANTPPSRLSNR